MRKHQCKLDEILIFDVFVWKFSTDFVKIEPKIAVYKFYCVFKCCCLLRLEDRRPDDEYSEAGGTHGRKAAPVDTLQRGPN